jgi:hypothetical protein
MTKNLGYAYKTHPRFLGFVEGLTLDVVFIKLFWPLDRIQYKIGTVRIKVADTPPYIHLPEEVGNALLGGLDLFGNLFDSCHNGYFFVKGSF